MRELFAFDSRAHLDGFLTALQTVVDRHDVLRTAILWENLPQPMQAVWRKAKLPIEQVSLAGDDPAAALWSRFELARIDVRQAPLIRVVIGHDPVENRWLLLLLVHHLVIDQVTLGLLLAEIHTMLSGETDKLPPPIPFRNFVAETRLGADRAKQEAFFREMLGDIDEPTIPLGLVDILGDGSAIAEARVRLDRGLSERLRLPSDVRASRPPACSILPGRWFWRGSVAVRMLYWARYSGRFHGGAGADRAFGLFLDTLPLRITMRNTSVVQALRETKAVWPNC